MLMLALSRETHPIRWNTPLMKWAVPYPQFLLQHLNRSNIQRALLMAHSKAQQHSLINHERWFSCSFDTCFFWLWDLDTFPLHLLSFCCFRWYPLGSCQWKSWQFLDNLENYGDGRGVIISGYYNSNGNGRSHGNCPNGLDTVMKHSWGQGLGYKMLGSDLRWFNVRGSPAFCCPHFILGLRALVPNTWHGET